MHGSLNPALRGIFSVIHKPDTKASSVAASMPTAPQFEEAMTNPAFYPFPADKVEVHRTHISLVFLAGDFAFKIKKPLDLGFLDFSTLEKRKKACEDELVLNRRLAPEIYLAVIPIFMDEQGALTLSPSGRPVEYAVKMKRLDQCGMFDVLLEQGKLDNKAMEELGGIMANFHARADARPSVNAYAFPEAILNMWAEDLAQVREHIPRVIPPEPMDLAEAFSKSFVQNNEALLLERIRENRIRDCHGDLHLQNICLNQGKVVVFDCIEFNEKFRCMDVASEIAFLAMDLECRGATALARAFTASYIEHAQDPNLKKLLSFYKCYRALVRAKIMCLRANGEPLGDMANQYAMLAAQYAAPFARPTLICMAGITGSGKSGVAQEMANLTGAVVFASDVIRKTMFGFEPTEKIPEPAVKEVYGQAASQKVYQSMLDQARENLGKGKSVILDATFTLSQGRKAAYDLAKECGVDFFLVVCSLPDEIAKERIWARYKDGQSVSDGTLAVYKAQKKEWQPTEEVPGSRIIDVQTLRPPCLLACKVLTKAISLKKG